MPTNRKKSEIILHKNIEIAAQIDSYYNEMGIPKHFVC